MHDDDEDDDDDDDDDDDGVMWPWERTQPYPVQWIDIFIASNYNVGTIFRKKVRNLKIALLAYHNGCDRSSKDVLYLELRAFVI